MQACVREVLPWTVHPALGNMVHGQKYLQRSRRLRRVLKEEELIRWEVEGGVSDEENVCKSTEA